MDRRLLTGRASDELPPRADVALDSFMQGLPTGSAAPSLQDMHEQDLREDQSDAALLKDVPVDAVVPEWENVVGALVAALEDKDQEVERI